MLAPLLTSNPPAGWRTNFLVEYRRTPEEFAYVRAIPDYSAVRMTNIYDHASQSLCSDLKARLNALKTCARADASAASCKRAEEG